MLTEVPGQEGLDCPAFSWIVTLWQVNKIHGVFVPKSRRQIGLTAKTLGMTTWGLLSFKITTLPRWRQVLRPVRPGTRPSLQPWVSRDSRGTPPTAGASRHPRLETGSRPEQVGPTLPFLTETKRDTLLLQLMYKAYLHKSWSKNTDRRMVMPRQSV